MRMFTELFERPFSRPVGPLTGFLQSRGLSVSILVLLLRARPCLYSRSICVRVLPDIIT